MGRITVSMPSVIARKATQAAAAQKRSVSAYVALLIEQDLREAGLLGVPAKTLVPANEAAALAECRKLGIDPLPHLAAVVADATLPSA